jgi:signal peptidase I
MNLNDYLDQHIELVGDNPKDSILISVKSPSMEIKTIAIDAETRKIYKDPYFEKESKKLRPKKDINSVFKIISTISFWLIICLTFLVLALRLTSVLSFNIILTGSMEPTIKPGDMIVTVNDRYLTPKLNDVVVYQGKRFDGTEVAPFAHRIIGGNQSVGWIMKGDANPSPDVQKPTPADILGVVVATIPNVGYFLNWKLLILLAVVFVSIFLTKEILREGND